MTETKEIEINMASIGGDLKHLQNDFSNFKSEVKSDLEKLNNSVNVLSANVTASLTNLKMAELKFEATDNRVKTIEEDLDGLKKNKIQPMETTVGAIKWAATISLGSVITFFLYILANHFNLF